MAVTFIRNHQYNFIKKQVDIIKDTYKKGTDKQVINAVKDSAYAKMIDLFQDHPGIPTHIFDLSGLATEAEFDLYTADLNAFIQPFPAVTEQQIKKMFPKTKKLKMPDLKAIDLERTTYLSWYDIGTNKKYIVYELNDRLVGIECRFNIFSRKNVCSFCNRHGQVAFISSVTKAKKINNPDYYKAIGNYICFDSTECNHQITSVNYLDSFIKEILQEK
ncbi:FusB/FusC family EF-G-binding protein [Peribacillus deserti]|uniref:Elongation factor G-binding protein n=1 Tax=Peribacillus deserti TaxID=673318 RepID=A0A2N5M4N2_9BACI|nr:FusB/FusC family EF-G-binding protein [Peribacillus deserti]PLT29331.1 elongation factor G-binding protein [Peribacillus deserti]